MLKKKYFVAILLLMILLSFQTNIVSANTYGPLYDGNAYFKNYYTGQIMGIHPDRVKKMYVWKSASTLDDPANEINGSTIRLEINNAYKSWEEAHSSLAIKVVSETTNYESATLRFFAMDFKVDANGMVTVGSSSNVGVAVPIVGGQQCIGTSSNFDNTQYANCPGNKYADRFDYAKIYINVPQMLRHQKSNYFAWTNQNIQATITHEIGHALGLRHQDTHPDSNSIMQQTRDRDKNVYKPTSLDIYNAQHRFKK